MSDWVEQVRACESVAQLSVLFEQLGGKANGEEFVRMFGWRKDELTRHASGGNLTSLSAQVQEVFTDWQVANDDFVKHGQAWALADAQLKKLQGTKYLTYKQLNGGPAVEVEARVNADDDILAQRLERNMNDALMRSDYKIIALLEAKWDYLQSLMVTERGQTDNRMSRPRDMNT